jgi:hypothetical protein
VSHASLGLLMTIGDEPHWWGSGDRKLEVVKVESYAERHQVKWCFVGGMRFFDKYAPGVLFLKTAEPQQRCKAHVDSYFSHGISRMVGITISRYFGPPQ